MFDATACTQVKYLAVIIPVYFNRRCIPRELSTPIISVWSFQTICSCFFVFFFDNNLAGPLVPSSSCNVSCSNSYIFPQRVFPTFFPSPVPFICILLKLPGGSLRSAFSTLHSVLVTWQLLEPLYNLSSSFLHWDSVLTHHQTKHNQRDELTRVRLKSINMFLKQGTPGLRFATVNRPNSRTKSKPSQGMPTKVCLAHHIKARHTVL